MRLDTDTSDWPDYFKVMIHPDERGRVIFSAGCRFIQAARGPRATMGELLRVRKNTGC
jgi:hypothetical protein